MRNMNNRGQAFIQVLFALGLMGVLSTAAVLMVRSSQEELALFTVKQGQLKLQQDLLMSLSRSAICGSILHANFDPSLPANPVSIDWPAQGSSPSGGSTIAAGVSLPEYGVTVTSFGFVMTPLPVPQIKLKSGSDVYSMTLRLSSTSYPGNKVFKDIEIGPLFYEVNGGKVVNCYDSTETARIALAACEKMGGQFDAGHCILPARFADIHCDAGYSIQSFNLNEPGARGCVSVVRKK